MYRERSSKAAHLLAALGSEFDHLGAENARLVKELEALREQIHGATSAPPFLHRNASLQTKNPFRYAPETPQFTPDTPLYSPDAPRLSPVTPRGPETPYPMEAHRQATHRASSDTPPDNVTPVATTTNGPMRRRHWGAQAGLDRFMRTDSEPLLEERYENFYDLSRAFHTLCARHKITIGAHEICEMDLCQNGCNPDEVDHDQEQVFRTLITEINRDFRVTTKNRQPAQEVMLETYNVLMSGTKAELKLERAGQPLEVVEAVTKMRDIFLREDAIRKIAHATNMGFTDIYVSSNRQVSEPRMEKVLRCIDPFIGLVILCNAVVIGLSTDFAPGHVAWRWCEFAFTAIFFVEIVVKLYVVGFNKHFCGSDMLWNLFDFFVVSIAVADIVVTVLGGFLQLRDLTLVRLLRFARLTRLVRVLKLKMFKELALLVNGCLAGFRTLIWAMVFLAFILFALGVMLTHLVGSVEVPHFPRCPNATHFPEEYANLEDAPNQDCLRSAAILSLYRQEMFGNVPRSMFTIFRCFTDGCNTPNGMPLVPSFYNTYGPTYVLIYMFVMLFVIFGLFNLIMAVFVENTIENAKHDDVRRREARTQEHIRVARKLQEIIMMFCTGENDSESSAGLEVSHVSTQTFGWFRALLSTRWKLQENLFGCMDSNPLKGMNASNLSLKVTHDSFHKILQKAEVRQLLDDLDIGYNSHSALFDVLDANCNGVLEVSELVQGLLKLRGAAEKGDIIASLLAIRSLQRSVKAIELLGLRQQDSIDALNMGQERVEVEVRRLMRGAHAGFLEAPQEEAPRHEGPRQEAPRQEAHSEKVLL